MAKASKHETIERKYNRLNKRIVRRLPVTASETAFVWREKSRRMMTERKSA
jgi:hypothetical protein